MAKAVKFICLEVEFMMKKKGGDIDLYIKPADDSHLLDKKIEFLIALEKELGEQKVDVVFAKDKDKDRNIEKEISAKGVELNIERIKLNKYFNECDKHLQRTEEAYSDMRAFLPLSVEKYKNLTKDEVQALDQYLFRFSKLQDTLENKIFSLIVQKYEPDAASLPFIDILNKLEKLGFLESAKEWLYLRKIRNDISHQYDDEPEEMTRAINNIANQKEVLKAVCLRVKDLYNRRFPDR